ncbi:carbohydrate-binding protein [Desulfolucanica intricata]|uniref:carbohydrate-binding protein n=1 Tax=Desulfolucanica intricata TaxID=1285191 RepID=UPI00082F2346|nr:carbohydrate-binding protein [Desulfolucanica intricata]
MARPTRYGEGHARLKAMHDADFPGGVAVDPTPITAGQEVTILYNGLLAKSGAQEVYLHMGFGDNRNWHGTKDVRMERTGWGFAKRMEMPEDRNFNFCFKDNAGNWDNNNGTNWTFQIHNGRMK